MMRFARKHSSFSCCLLAAVLSGYGWAQSVIKAPSETWVGSWATSQQIPEPQNALATEDLHDVTVREIVHLSVGGSMLRVHVSNAFGTEPLHVSALHVARPVALSSAAITPGSDVGVTFFGSPDVLIPAGAEYVSDPVKFAAAPLSSLAISYHLDSPPAGQTGHPGSRATSYYAHGNLVSAPDLPTAKHVDHWYQIAGVDVLASADGGAIVVLGDSITDGHGATTNGNDRWTDVLAERLQASAGTRNIAVLNQGIGGNHLLTDGLGPNALARFDRDVLAQPGVHWVIVFEGINDLGGLTRDGEVPAADHALLVRRVTGAYQQMIDRAHSHGLKVLGATLTPFMESAYYHPGPASEADRQRVNAWIRAAGHFDAVVDFDEAVRDPAQPERLLPEFDSGDHLHPSPAGYRTMANAIPLTLFK